MTKPKIIAEHKVSNSNNIPLCVTVKGPIASKKALGRNAFCIRVKGKTPEWKATAEEARLRATQIVEEFVGSGAVAEPGTFRAAIELYCADIENRRALGLLSGAYAKQAPNYARSFIETREKIVKPSLLNLPAKHWRCKHVGRYEKDLSTGHFLYEVAPRIFQLPDGSVIQPGRMKCSEMTTDVIKSLITYLTEKNGWQPQTADMIKNLLSGVFKIALQKNWCVSNPCNFSIEFAKHSRTEDEIIAEAVGDNFITPKAFEAIAKIAEDREQSVGNVPWCHALALYFLAYTGLRPGELFPLKWSSLDLDNNLVHVRVAVRRADNYGEFEIGEPKNTSRQNKKNKKIRDVELPPRLVAKLKAWKLRSPLSSDDDRVFLSQTLNMHHTAQYLREAIWYPACVEHGLTKEQAPTLYDLRHVFATTIFEQHKGDLDKIANLMGHADINLTRRVYAEYWENKSEAKTIAAEREAVWERLVNE